MARTLTIAGADFQPQYQTHSLDITERLQNKSNSARFTVVQKAGEAAPAEGSEVIITDTFHTGSARRLFAGFLTQKTPRETGKGQLIAYDVECTDYTYILINREAQIAYQSKTLKYIVEDLLSRYAGDQGFDTTNVATGPTIASITFDHISLRACFEKLAKRTGYVWWVDYDKNVHFQLPTATAAPVALRDSDTTNHESVQIEYDVSQVRNVVRVIGSENGERSASYAEQEFTADGATRSWELDDKPDEIVFIKVDGVEQDFSLDLNERETDDFVYSFNDAQVRVAANGAVPANGQTILVRYYPRAPIIIERRDPDSIAFFAALEGGDGTHFYTIADASISSKDEARARADQELEDFADALVNGRFTTSSNLVGTAIISPGQYLTVNMPSWNIGADTALTVQEVRIRVADRDTAPVFQYEVRFGGKLVGVQEFLESLVARREDEGDVTEIKTIYGLSDAMALDDNTPTVTKHTPPFQYGPGGNPQGVWNKSEYA